MKKLFSEDQKMYDVQRQVKGLGASTDPQANTLGALLDTNKQQGDNHEAPVLKPYPLNVVTDLLATMFTTNLEVFKKIGETKENPSLKKKHKKLLDDMEKKVGIINDVIVELSEDVDKIG